MTLTNRLSAYFLGWSAFGLIGFSLALYAVVRADFRRDIDGRLQAGLDTLSAACETEENGVEWEAKDRPHAFERMNGDDETAWLVLDERGTIVDRSRSKNPDWLLQNREGTARTDLPQSVEHRESTWRVLTRRIEPRETTGAMREQAKQEGKYPSLTIVIAVSRAGSEKTLHYLGLLMLGLSSIVWLIAGFLGRRLCRRALAPVTEMATAARDFRGNDPQDRLPVRPTHDELEELGVAFNDLLDRVEESFERQRRFTGEASHQLRTPLTAMRGQIEVVLRRERSGEEYRRVLGTLDGQVQHLHSIIEMLLFLARADSETTLPELTSIDVRAWLTEFVQNWPDRRQRERIAFACENSEGWMVRMHGGLFGQLLGNLLDNALKHSPVSSPVAICLEKQSDRIYLEVIDRGSGIAPEDLPHLFEPFFRSDASRKAGLAGVGLGLAVAKRIAEAMAATLSVTGVQGHGSCFRLEFAANAVEERIGR